MSDVRDVFLSHNSNDKPLIREIAKSLEEAGLRVWFDEWDLIPGLPWQEELEKGLAESKSIAVFISRHGIGRWVQPEMRAALSEQVNRGVSVIPVLLPSGPDPTSLPVFLKANTAVDMRESIDEVGLYRLRCGIRREKPRPTRTSGPTIIPGAEAGLIVFDRSRIIEDHAPAIDHAIGENPYMGVSAFHEEDVDRFFGREEQTQELWNKFRDLHETSPSAITPLRLLAVYGPSGSGKSSVARAGLIPQLARNPLPGFKRARVAVLTPGAHPLEALAAVLARIATGDAAPVAKTRELRDELRLNSPTGEWDGLRRIAEALPGIAASPLIVLVDQFEEIYSLCQTDPKEKVQEREVFVENLLIAAADISQRVSVIITLRSDFLGETQSNETLNSAISQRGFLVPAMSVEQLWRAITEPAKNAGHPFEDGTVNQLILETKDRVGALPLLQFALTQMWAGLADGVAPADTLKKIGGVGGALAGEAQRIFERLNVDDQAIARRAFLELIQLGEGTRDTRRRVPLESMLALDTDEERVRQVIQVFSRPAARLVTLSGSDDGLDLAEVTHESLIDNWQLLRKWLDDNRDDIRFQRSVKDAADSWNKMGRPDGSLWRPPNLDLLQRFHERSRSRKIPLELTLRQLDFYIASRQAEDRRIAEEQQQRRTLEQQRDTLQAQKEALEQQQVTLGKQRETLQGRLKIAVGAAVIAILLLCVAIGLGVFADSQRRNAARAEKERITDKVKSLLGADPSEVRRILKDLGEVQNTALLALRELDSKDQDLKGRVRLALALLSADDDKLTVVLKGVAETEDAAELKMIQDVLTERGKGRNELWSLSESDIPVVRFRALCVLAGLDPTNDRWREASTDIVGQLLSQPTRSLPSLLAMLEPVRDSLFDRLESTLRNTDSGDSAKVTAATVLAHFASGDVVRLAKLASRAEPAHYKNFYDALALGDNRVARETLAEIVGQQTVKGAAELEAIRDARNRATAALTLLRLGEREVVLGALSHPESMTQFIHRCGAYGVTAKELLECLRNVSAQRSAVIVNDAEQRRQQDPMLFGLLLALGEFNLQSESEIDQEWLRGKLLGWYRTDPSSAIHSATGWLLRHQWDRQLEELPERYDPKREWYTLKVDLQPPVGDTEGTSRTVFLTYVVFQPGSYEIGSALPPEVLGSSDADKTREKLQVLQTVEVTRPFAILDREITVAEFESSGLTRTDEKYPKVTFPNARDDGASDNSAIAKPCWYDTVRFCRWLTAQAGFLEEQQPYPEPESLLQLNPDLHQRDEGGWARGAPTNWPMNEKLGGFRLPKETEWEIACRAGTHSAFHFGSDITVLRKYAWYAESVKERGVKPVRDLRPNLRGLFDMQGNVREWCDDWHKEGQKTCRGGGWLVSFADFRSSYRSGLTPGGWSMDIGFRLAQTLPADE